MGSHKDDQGVKIGGEWKFSKNPDFLQERSTLWDELYQKQQQVYQNFEKKEIKITLPDGKVIPGTSF